MSRMPEIGINTAEWSLPRHKGGTRSVRVRAGLLSLPGALRARWDKTAQRKSRRAEVRASPPRVWRLGLWSGTTERWIGEGVQPSLEKARRRSQHLKVGNGTGGTWHS
ncbi:uncharacterized protein LOC143477495 [Brachyhypopomus gauderio]|uniref:uncharacterized protein LOC143477495 n=1 Tax=Brachyhypopomus gauderio TaxID=698409 RepID=UPI0040424F90